MDVTDYFRISLAGSIESEAGFNHFILQVTVDSLRTTDYLYTIVLGCIIFGQYAGIGIRVVTTDNNQSFDIQFFQDLISFFELIFLLQLGTTRSDDIKTTGVTIFINNISCQLHIIMVYQTARAKDEAIKTAVFVQFLNTVEQTGNHVMSTRSLSA